MLVPGNFPAGNILIFLKTTYILKENLSLFMLIEKKTFFILFIIFIIFACEDQESKKIFPEKIQNDRKLYDLLIFIKRNNLYNLPNELFDNPAYKFSDKQIQVLIDTLPQVKKYLPNPAPVIEIIARHWGREYPQKIMDIIEANEGSTSYLYATYTMIINEWLKTDPQKAEKYIMDKTISWGGPLTNMGKELRESNVALKLETGLDKTLKWIEQADSDTKKLKLTEALYAKLAGDHRIKDLADWMKTKTDEDYFRFLFGKVAESYGDSDPVSAMAWVHSLNVSPAKYIAARSLFEYLGFNYANIAVHWFNTASERYQFGNYQVKTSGFYISSAAFREDFIAAFIKGLLDNKEIAIHPSTVVKRITDKYYGPLVKEEYERQMRRLDPVNMENE